MTTTDRQRYLDACERHYQNARDDGWPMDRAKLYAEAEATAEVGHDNTHATENGDDQ